MTAGTSTIYLPKVVEQDVNVLSSSNKRKTSFINAGCAWSGRVAVKVAQGANAAVCAIAKTVQNAFQHLFRTLAAGTADPDCLATTFRKIEAHTLRLVEKLAAIPGFFDKVRGGLRNTIGCIDFIQTANSINYLCSRQFVKDTKVKVMARLSILVADIAGAALWLKDLGFSCVSNAAAKVGNFRLFGFVPKAVSVIPGLRNIAWVQKSAATLGNLRIFSYVATKAGLAFIAGRALALGYAFFAVDALQRLLAATVSCERKQAALELARYIAELVLDAMILVGVTSIVGLGTVGTACAGLALGAIVHKAYNRKALDAAEKEKEARAIQPRFQEIELQTIKA